METSKTIYRKYRRCLLRANCGITGTIVGHDDFHIVLAIKKGSDVVGWMTDDYNEDDIKIEFNNKLGYWNVLLCNIIKIYSFKFGRCHF